MELSRVGSDLFGSTESQVLGALARLSDPVSGRQLTKLAGVDSNSTVQRYLAKLRRMGLVHATEIPSATLYRLNRDHVFWAAIEQVLTAPTQIEGEIAGLVQRLLGATARVAVFGSVAAGTAGADSDYDLLLIVDDQVSPAARAEAVAALAESVEALTGNECQVVDVSESELRDLAVHNSALVQEWKKYARPVDGGGQIRQLQTVE
ncbi:MAG: nucleotidyltransferase domain-containing protein [Rhodoglobus sp.]